MRLVVMLCKFHTDNLARAADQLTRTDHAAVVNSMGAQMPDSLHQQVVSGPAVSQALVVTSRANSQCLPLAGLARRPVTGMQH